MSQRRAHSALEASLSTASGFVLSYAVGLVVYPLMGWRLSPAQNFWVVLVFTVLSLVRQYLWRRGFNWMHQQGWL